ncbi:hypothetical protein HFD88_004005 [Aspergillus terreus]|nr:hypothetical protein HFD88_004005 [Aspergillus terreus]
MNSGFLTNFNFIPASRAQETVHFFAADAAFAPFFGFEAIQSSTVYKKPAQFKKTNCTFRPFFAHIVIFLSPDRIPLPLDRVGACAPFHIPESTELKHRFLG